MKERYKNILEKVYEIEGLLLLALSKEEMPEGLEQLIERRISELTEEETTSKKSAGTEFSLPIPEEETKDETDTETDTFYALEDDDDDKPSGRLQKVTMQRKAPVFSLNDRFLFMRELFDNDAAAFNAMLQRVAALDDYPSAVDYLREEWSINPEGDTDARFLAVIEDYFR